MYGHLFASKTFSFFGQPTLYPTIQRDNHPYTPRSYIHQTHVYTPPSLLTATPVKPHCALAPALPTSPPSRTPRQWRQWVLAARSAPRADYGQQACHDERSRNDEQQDHKATTTPNCDTAPRATTEMRATKDWRQNMLYHHRPHKDQQAVIVFFLFRHFEGKSEYTS